MDENINRLISNALRKHNIEEARRLINEISLSLFETWERGFNFLCYALRDRQFEIAELLIKSGCKLRTSNNKTTALHVAILNAIYEIIKLIHKSVWKDYNTCNFLDEDDEGKNVFHLFMYRTPVDNECRKILHYLLQNCPITVTSSVTQLSPIHYAAKYGNTQMIQLLLAIDKTQVNNVSKFMKYTPLHFATERGHLDVVPLLLKNFAQVNAKTINDESALCLAVKLRLQSIVHILLPYYTQKFNFYPYLLKEEQMLIYSAVQSRNFSILEFFLMQGLNPNIWEERSKMTPLFLAIEQECLSSVKLLINYGADLNITKQYEYSEDDETFQGYSVLHFAAKCRNEQIFSYLLDEGATLNIFDVNRQNPLHIATRLENLAIIRLILTRGQNILSLFTKDLSGMTPLHIAVEGDNQKILDEFLDAGVPVDLKTETKLSAMHLGAKWGLFSIVQLLAKRGGKTNVSGGMDFETPLFYAALSGNLDLVRFLTKNSLKSSKWIEGYVSLYAASYNGHEDIVRFLIKEGADSNLRHGNFLSPLHAAAQRGHKSIVKLLIETGAFVEREERTISTPFLTALSHGHDSIAQMIQNHQQINVNAKLRPAVFKSSASEFESLLVCGYESRLEFHEQLKVDYTPIFFAIQSGNLDRVRNLIENGASVNVTAQSGETPLLLAIKSQSIEAVSYLLEKGAELSENSPLLFTAISLNNLPIVDLLLEKGHPIDYVGNFGNQEGFTVMHLAIRENNLSIVDALLRKDFDLETCTEKDYVLHYAIDKNNKEIILRLINHGASLNSTCFKGLNPSLHALLAGNTKMFTTLVKKGAHLLERSILGKNLLHFALDNNLNENVIKFLIELGINVNEKNEFLLSPIERIINDQNERNDFIARYSQLIEGVKDKLDDILDQSSKNWNQNQEERDESEKVCDDTFNGSMVKQGFYATEKIFGYFLQYGMDVNTPIDLQQQTILHYTCICSNIDSVQMLILHNPDFNVIDQRGRTPFFYAVDYAMWAWSAFHQECCSDIYNEEEELLISSDLHWDDFDDLERYSRRSTEIKLKKILRNRNAFKQIARYMTQALVKIEAIGHEIHQENRKLLESETVHIYCNLCKVEI